MLAIFIGDRFILTLNRISNIKKNVLAEGQEVCVTFEFTSISFGGNFGPIVQI